MPSEQSINEATQPPPNATFSRTLSKRLSAPQIPIVPPVLIFFRELGFLSQPRINSRSGTVFYLTWTAIAPSDCSIFLLPKKASDPIDATVQATATYTSSCPRSEGPTQLSSRRFLPLRRCTTFLRKLVSCHSQGQIQEKFYIRPRTVNVLALGRNKIPSWFFFFMP